MNSLPWKAWAGWALRLSLTGLILWLALRRVPLAAIPGALGRLNLPLALVSVATFLLGNFLVEPLRLMAAGRVLQESQPRFSQWLALYAESRPFFYVLPASAGAEGMVWVRLRRYQWTHASCGFVVFMTRVVGTGTWALGAALALEAHDGCGRLLAQAPGFLRLPAFWGAGGALVLLGALLAPGWMRHWKHLPVVSRRGAPLAGMILLSLASALVNALSVHGAALSAHTSLGMAGAVGFLAFFNFAMILPISLGGFGLQEAMILGLGLPLGYPAPALIAFSIVLHIQRLTLSLIGLGAYLRPGRTVPDLVSAEG